MGNFFAELFREVLGGKLVDILTKERVVMSLTILWGSMTSFWQLSWPNFLLGILIISVFMLWGINLVLHLRDRWGGNLSIPVSPEQKPKSQLQDNEERKHIEQQLTNKNEQITRLQHQLDIMGKLMHEQRATTWLEAIADDDSENMPRRIYVVYVRMGTKTLTVAEPFLDIEIGIRNCSVYPVTLSKEIEGKVQLQESPLHLSPEIIVRGGSPLTIQHAGFLPIILRQRLFPEAAQQIAQDNTAQLSVGKVALWFTYQDRFDTPQRVRVAAGNIVSPP